MENNLHSEEPSRILKKRDDIEVTEQNEKERAELVLSLLSSIEFDKVLDIGCGLGTCMKLLKPLTKEIIGLDIYPIGTELNPDLDIRKFDLNDKLPFNDKEFDLVIATEVLVDLFYPYTALKEIKRVLKDDGFAVISLPNSYNIYNRKDMILGKNLSYFGFDKNAHHYLTNLSTNKNFICIEFDIVKEKYQWITKGKIGSLVRVLKHPGLFSRSIIALCKKKKNTIY